MVQGPYRQELRNFFAAEIPEELNHAQLLADKIAALGGTPSATPAQLDTIIADETRHRDELRQMLARWP